MVKYLEVSNVFKALDSDHHYLIFIADNALSLEVAAQGAVAIRVNSEYR